MATAKTKTVVVYKKAKKKNRRSKFTLPLAVVAGFMPGVATVVDYTQKYGIQGGMTQLSRVYTGFDPQTNKWYPSLLWQGLTPLLIGTVVHKVASLVGVNRALARAGVPFLRI